MENTTATPHSQNNTADPRRYALAPADVFENKDELVVLVDLPGVRKDDVAVHLDKDQLTIEGKRTAAQNRGAELVSEYRALSFRRQFVVTPGSIDVEKIKADLQNGVLRLTLPKTARMKPRTIAVTGS